MVRMMLGAVLAVAALAATAGAQVITLETKATPDELQQWLRSGDARLVAWGATLAREQNDEHALRTMVEMVEQWKGPENRLHPTHEDTEMNEAMVAVLDGLIQRKVHVGVDGLRAVAPGTATTFGAQALALASQMPVSEAAPLLLDWYRETLPASPSFVIYPETEEGRRLTWMGHIAGMMLAKEPPAGFAALVVEESVERVEFDVVDNGMGFGTGSGGSCGDRLGTSVQPGWPEIFTYGIVPDSQGGKLALLVEAGGESLYLSRYPNRGYGGGCGRSDDGPAWMRRRLLAEMVGVDPSGLPWRAEDQRNVEWSDGASLRRVVMETVEAEERKLGVLVTVLANRGFLTRDEARAVRTKLLVVVRDMREKKEPRLPRMELHDPHDELRYE